MTHSVSSTYTDYIGVRHTFTRSSAGFEYKCEVQIVHDSTFQEQELVWRQFFNMNFPDLVTLQEFVGNQPTGAHARVAHALEMQWFALPGSRV